ncbi:unnamed protein product [Staurois parvus]|uniref:Uncharacterized protein n=1 Tax=Staurois parvus TaxID=386267 RepID=A0ABN9GXK1_9NEOB|nr:unnamed protein product [Staurois parvus]
MVRWHLGHMTGPRSRRTNHKAQLASRSCALGTRLSSQAPTLQKPGRQRGAG